MDAEVAELVRQERLLEAAELAAERGDARSASILYERGCDWRSASAQALRADDPTRALELAVWAADDAMAEQALARVGPHVVAADSAAERLARRGQHAWAARLLEACGRTLEAARAWERAGDDRRAASLLERRGEPVQAARVLEAALRRDAQAWGSAADLGTLLARFGKWEAAVRVLQRIPAGAPERRDALVTLVPAFEQLGLRHAAREAAGELDSLGGAPLADPSPALLGSPDDNAFLSPPTHTTPAAPTVHRLFSRYDVVREVASSASARVLECIDVVRGERVAVKLFAAWQARGSGRDALARFEREVRAMKSIGHPNIVPLHDYVAEAPAIVLAWMGGGTLEQMLARTSIAPSRAIEISAAVLSALGEAHRMGIVHRDVKPANVLFDDSGVAHLGDFGVAHLGDVSTTATAGLFGTLAYMSPEQRQGRPAGAGSDIFAVGVMLREMLTGERPDPHGAPGRLPSEAHHELDARHDAVLAALTAPDDRTRPGDTFAARALLAGLPWPAAVDSGRLRPRVERKTPDQGSQERVETRADGTQVDLWTGRELELVPLTERVLSRARVFARADHPALQTVWRVDRRAGAVWLEALPGHALDRPLATDERHVLQGALAALHGAGGVHGRVDARHLTVRPGGIVLRFSAEQDPTATADGDWIALARL